MIAVIRISGLVKIQKAIQDALYRLRLRRKYSLVLLKPKREELKLLKKLRNHIAYGDINKETLRLLIERRGKTKAKLKKPKPEEIMEQIEKRSPKTWDIKPFFLLHPPRGGIDSKMHFSTTKKAVLGDNKDKINDLIRRML